MEIPKFNTGNITAKILSGGMHDYNDFTNPDKVKPADFKDIKKTGNEFEFIIPACSVMGITIL